MFCRERESGGSGRSQSGMGLAAVVSNEMLFAREGDDDRSSEITAARWRPMRELVGYEIRLHKLTR